MPIFTLFFSFIIAAITGIVLSSIFNENGQSPAWIHHVFMSIIAAGVVASAITKQQICKLCSLISLKNPQVCQCQHA